MTRTIAENKKELRIACLVANQTMEEGIQEVKRQEKLF
jgi:hypothetical protein